jgi:hypothetical protein
MNEPPEISLGQVLSQPWRGRAALGRTRAETTGDHMPGNRERVSRRRKCRGLP